MLLNEKIRYYRPQIMGVATVGIILVHSIGIIEWMPVFKKVFGFGGIGVYIFVFLSAIGLYNSLKNRGGYSKSEFYKKRIIRLIIPYVLIAGTWYGITDLLINRNLVLFLYNISTISFWLEHKGAWYVAMLIPVYLIFPWFFDWAEAKNRNMRVLGSLCTAVMLSLVFSIIFPKMYEHLAQVFLSVIVYLIGYYYAGLDSKTNKSGIVLSTICLVLFITKTISSLKNVEFISGLTWGMLGIPLTFLTGWLLNIINSRGLNLILGFFGKYSLEMYLWNIFVIQAMKIFNVIDILKSNGDVHGYISYSIIVVSGSFLSVLYGKLSVFFVHRFAKK